MDFDSPYKQEGKFTHPRIESDEPHALVIALMRSDKGLARDILGRPLRDAQAFSEANVKKGIPTVAVFTGFGFHVHTLYQPRYSPETEMYTTANKYYIELDLLTADTAIHGDVRRILKVPNTERVQVIGDRSYPCNLWNIPLTAEELKNATIEWLLEESKGPRQIEIPESFKDENQRPEMTVYEKYTKERTSVDSGAQYDKEIRKKPLVPFEAPKDCEWIIREVVSMPCMQEHLLQPNPHHKVRQNFAVMMFNAGFTQDDVHNIIRQMGWRDYDYNKTKYQLQQIWEGKYVDMGCNSMWLNGYCVYDQDPKKCPTYKWRGGSCEY